MTRYEIIEYVDGEWKQTETTDIMAWAAEHGVEATAEFGESLLVGFHGPCGGEEGTIRYENWAATKILSD